MNFSILEMRLVLATLYNRIVFRNDPMRLPHITTKVTSQPCEGIHMFIRTHEQMADKQKAN